jgi:hypothetical protein
MVVSGGWLASMGEGIQGLVFALAPFFSALPLCPIITLASEIGIGEQKARITARTVREVTHTTLKSSSLRL